MAQKTFNQIKESVLTQYKKDYPDESLYGRIFSLYILDRYAKLLFRLYEKAEKGKK